MYGLQRSNEDKLEVVGDRRATGLIAAQAADRNDPWERKGKIGGGGSGV